VLGRALDHIDWQPGVTLAACFVVLVGIVGMIAGVFWGALEISSHDAIMGRWAFLFAASAVAYLFGAACFAAIRRQRREEARDLMDAHPFVPNEDCPCGSGSKVKHCHDELAQ